MSTSTANKKSQEHIPPERECSAFVTTIVNAELASIIEVGDDPHKNFSDLCYSPNITQQPQDSTRQRGTLVIMVSLPVTSASAVAVRHEEERVFARCFGGDLKRKLLTRGFFHSLSPSWLRIAHTSGRVPLSYSLKMGVSFDH